MKIEIKLVPDGMDLYKAIQDGTPVDKVSDMDGGFMCPVATQDVETNEENKRYAIKDHQYGPAINPDQSCGTCAAFKISPEMQQCMKDDSGEVGYCQSLKFMCSAENSCALHVEGGPMADMPE